MTKTFFAFCLFYVLFSNELNAQNGRHFNLEVTCEDSILNGTQSVLKFKWLNISPAARINRVYRKTKASYVFGSVYRNLTLTDTVFKDTILTGQQFEYRFERDSGQDGYYVYGYINAGSRVTFPTNRGTVLLVIDSANRPAIDTALRTFRNDLIGDGWFVRIAWISSSTTVSQVKSRIVSEYTSDNTINTVTLIGDIAVPYSGDFRSSGFYPPDGHTTFTPPSHEGAWPADCYFGELNATWTDNTVNNTIGAYSANNNTIGDGKFDHTFIPNLIDLQIGRIDLSDLGSFSLSQSALLKRYFEKNHRFKHKKDTIQERALIDDNFGVINYPYPFKDEYFGGNTYKMIAPLLGHNKVSALDYLSNLNTNSYLFSFGMGAGGFSSCSGVGTTANLANSSQQVKSVFSGFMGSYFGDWDNANNFLRAPLAARGNVLNTFWMGRPHWFLHHMAMGETIGYGWLRTINNFDVGISSYLYPTARRVNTVYFNYEIAIHIGLMGDPTVRMQPVKPSSFFIAHRDSCSNRVRLRWSQSEDTAVHDYYIFRANHIDNAFSYIGTTQNLTYTDNSPLSGNNVYMLRGLKLQKSGSGSYYNMFQGLFDTVNTNDFYIPQAFAGRDTAVCRGSIVNLGRLQNNPSEVIYTWNPTINNRDTASYTITSNQNFIQIATDTITKCSRRDTVAITSLNLPVAETINSNILNACQDSIIWSNTNNNGSNHNYRWFLNGGLPNDTTGNMLTNIGTIFYPNTGNFSTILRTRNNTTTCFRQDTFNFSVVCQSLSLKDLQFECLTNNQLRILNTENNIENVKIEVSNGKEWKTIYLNYSIKYGLNIITHNFDNIIAYRFSENGNIMYFECSNNKNSQISINPNPFNGIVQINFNSNISKNKQIIIYDKLGQKIASYNTDESKIDLNFTFLKNGIYTLEIIESNLVYYYKIVKVD